MSENAPRTVVVVDGPGGGAETARAIEAAAAAIGLDMVAGPDGDAAVQKVGELVAAGREVAAIVLGPHTPAPLAAARRIHAAAPVVHLVFVVGADGGAALRREIVLAPRIGTGWTIAREEPDSIAAALYDAARATRQRARHRTTLSRARTQLHAALVDAGAARSGPDAVQDALDAAALRHVEEQRRIARLEVTQAMVDEPDLVTAAPRILRALGGRLGWACALLWMVDRDANVLRCAEVWRGEPGALEGFVAASRARDFAPGESVPGEVWDRRVPEIVLEVATEPRYARGEIAAAEGLRTAYLHPIVLGRDVLGVLELIGRERRELDPDFQELMASAAGSIGQLAERGRITGTLRRQNDDLIAADRRKNEFLAMVAHELRNPLAPIGNAIRILQDTAATTAEHGQARGAIERQVRTLTRLVDDLLDVSAISIGKIQLRTERVEVAPVIARAIDTARAGIERSGLALTVLMPSEPLWIDADPIRIEQVVTNLLINATKYTDRGGRIWVTAAPVGPTTGQRRVVIAVRDTGIGLAEDLRDKVFDMFAQAPESRGRDRGGLGIGLTLVKRLVELHGGEVAVASAGRHKGSEFSIRLPLVQAFDAAPAAPPPAVVLAPAPRRALRVLIVDDNTDAADTLEIVLRRDGHEVRTAYDGLAAVTAANAFEPDIVLLDIGLPGMSGHEVAARIRTEPRARQPVLVAVTGWGMEADRERTRALGFAHHVVKPARLAEIREILASVPLTAS